MLGPIKFERAFRKAMIRPILRKEIPFPERKGKRIEELPGYKWNPGRTPYRVDKTKREIVDEYSQIVELTIDRMAKAVAEGVLAIACVYLTLRFGVIFSLPAAVIGAKAMYDWWQGGADYSNYQEFERRPILVPLEDVSQPGKGSGSLADIQG